MGEKVLAQTRARPSQRFEQILPLQFAFSFHNGHLEALGGHALRVAAYTYAMARAYGLDETLAKKLRQASQFHDIGKLLVPKKLLEKPAPLSPRERQQIQQHTVEGSKLLLSSRHATLREAATIALCHHEHFNGSGYPYGLSGSAIPLAARLVSVADVFDALTSHRVYRPALSQYQALTFIKRMRAEQFDPVCVDALSDTLETYPGLQEHLRRATETYSDAAARHTRDESTLLTPELLLEAWHEHAAWAATQAH